MKIFKIIFNLILKILVKNKKFLGKIPINTELRKSADLGLPLTYKKPDHEISKIFYEIAKKITKKTQNL